METEGPLHVEASFIIKELPLGLGSLGLLLQKGAALLMAQNLGKVDWDTLSRNTNATNPLKDSHHSIDRYSLSGSTNATYLSDNNLGRANWLALSANVSYGIA